MNTQDEILDPQTLVSLLNNAQGANDNVLYIVQQQIDDGYLPSMPVQSGTFAITLSMLDGSKKVITRDDQMAASNPSSLYASGLIESYIGIPEQFRQYCALPSGIECDGKYHGFEFVDKTVNETTTPTLHSHYVFWNYKPTNVVYQTPSGWHGFWPSGYEYRTFPELITAFSGMATNAWPNITVGNDMATTSHYYNKFVDILTASTESSSSSSARFCVPVINTDSVTKYIDISVILSQFSPDTVNFSSGGLEDKSSLHQLYISVTSMSFPSVRQALRVDTPVPVIHFSEIENTFFIKSTSDGDSVADVINNASNAHSINRSYHVPIPPNVCAYIVMVFSVDSLASERTWIPDTVYPMLAGVCDSQIQIQVDGSMAGVPSLNTTISTS